MTGREGRKCALASAQKQPRVLKAQLEKRAHHGALFGKIARQPRERGPGDASIEETRGNDKVSSPFKERWRWKNSRTGAYVQAGGEPS